MGVSWVYRAFWVSYEQVSFDGLLFMKNDNIITSDNKSYGKQYFSRVS